MDKSHARRTPNPKAATSRELAGELNVSIRTVQLWTERGIIKPEFHVGKVIRYDLEKAKASLVAASCQ